ncbi:6-pyruvoyl tetrahydropterin synthase [Halobacteriales archaeon QS_4_69_34]|jgi:6-pyruvoyltetrahydropterin/6-carboxytetrahydropterin synthase|nr:MAG: 6-pyruvoyl tetrahydropterin synthase [Halobacteriales archaeon QS_4_69_34]
MYTVTVIEEFLARHWLTVPDPGPEGEVNAHRFRVELTLSGAELNEHDYLVDIDDAETVLADVGARYGDATLNDLPEFEGHNPSVERFARVVWERAVGTLDTDGIDEVAVKIWEDDDAWAAYEGSP